MYDVIIIGGGPAGITAGIYAARKKLNTLLITKDFVGQVGKTGPIENYPGLYQISGLELLEKFKNQLKEFKVEIKTADIGKIRKVQDKFIIQTKRKENFIGKSVIVASGRDPRPLEIPGEKELIGKGVSYCEICDAPFFKDKIVVVIGGGNSGFEAAIGLAKFAKKIYILEHSSKVLADGANQERAKKTGKVKVILNAKATKILGTNLVKGLIYEDRIQKKEKALTIDGVFVMIGQIPATGFIKDLVDFNKIDEVKINSRTCETKTPGIFAAGDVTDVKYKQIVIACAEGAKAALSAYEYLEKQKSEKAI